MSWKENRRRKRVWYRHYRELCNELASLAAGANGPTIPASRIIEMFFNLYERRRLHGKRRVADSAAESLKLALADSNLDGLSFQPTRMLSKGTGRSLSFTVSLDPTYVGELPVRRDVDVDVYPAPPMSPRPVYDKDVYPVYDNPERPAQPDNGGPF